MTTTNNTLVMYFEHNLDAALAAKTLQAAMLENKQDAICRLVSMTVHNPDAAIAKELSRNDGVTDICIMGYCPEDFTTLNLTETYPAMGITYFLYENNIQLGGKLIKLLKERGLDGRVHVVKPSVFKSDELPCGNSLCAMMIEMSTHGKAIDYRLGSLSAMSAISRWFTMAGTSASDLRVAWAVRYDAEIRDGFADSDSDLGMVVTTSSPVVDLKRQAMLDAMYNTMAARKVVIQESLKVRNTSQVFRTFVVSAEHNHDVYRRLIGLWDNFIIVNRVSSISIGEGFLVNLALGDTTQRNVYMQQLGVTRWWMEGNMCVGFTPTNPLH